MKINNSVYNGIIALKNQLTSSINEQNNILDILTNAIMIDFPEVQNSARSAAIARKVLTLNTGETVAIEKHANESNLIFTWEDENGNTDTAVEPFDIFATSRDERLFGAWIVDGNDIAPHFTRNDIMYSLADGEVINEAICKVNELFLLNSNVSNSDIISAINTVKGGMTNDLNTLKTFILNSSNEGKISNYGWLTLVSNICKESKNTVDDDSLVVSEESFFALQSFLQTVLSVASAVISSVCLILSTIFGGLINVLGVVFNAIGSLFSATFDTEYNYHANATYPGIKGTFYAGRETKVSSIANVPNNTAVRICYGSEDVYCFQQADPSNPNNKIVYIQSQPIMMFHPDRFLNYLRNQFTATVTTISGDFKSIRLNKNLIPCYDTYLPSEDSVNYPFLKLEDYINMGTDKNFMIRTLKTNIIAALLLREPNLTLSTGSVTATSFEIAHYEHITDFKYIPLAFLYEVYCTNNNINTILNKVSVADIRSIVTGMSNMYSNTNLTTYVYNNGLYDIFSCQYFNRPLRSIRDYVGEGSTIYISVSDTLDIREPIDDHLPDCIPTEDMISIPSLDVSTVVAAIAVVASVIAASVIVGKKMNAVLKAKKQLRQTKRIATLNSYRDQYISNPTKETAQAYTRAMSSYNFKASLFGWGSYDAQNGWMNSVSNSSEQTTNAIADFIDNNTLINEIRNLIS